MAITTYAELQTALTNWLDRSDLSARIPEFIALFEAKANRRLRVRQQLVSTTLAPSDGVASLPSDYLEWKRVTWAGSPLRELEYVEPTYFIASFPDSPSDTPRYFTIEGSSLKVIPISDTNITFVYYEKIDALSDAATTNWLLTAHPDLYLFGSMAEAMSFGEDIAMALPWAQRSEAIYAELDRLSEASRGQAQIRAYGPTP